MRSGVFLPFVSIEEANPTFATLIDVIALCNWLLQCVQHHMAPQVVLTIEHLITFAAHKQETFNWSMTICMMSGHMLLQWLFVQELYTTPITLVQFAIRWTYRCMFGCDVQHQLGTLLKFFSTFWTLASPIKFAVTKLKMLLLEKVHRINVPVRLIYMICI